MSLKGLTEADAINDGLENLSILRKYLIETYLEGNEKSEIEFCKIYHKYPKSLMESVINPNKTNIDWFEKPLYSINPLVINLKSNTNKKANFFTLNCFFNCEYCYGNAIYQRFNDSFKKGFYVSRLNGIKKCKDYCFIANMLDFFHPKVPYSLIRFTIQHLNSLNKDVQLYYLTKNPNRYSEFIEFFNEKDYNWIGITVESDSYSYQKRIVSDAVDPSIRLSDFAKIDYPRKYISLEPILKFDEDKLVNLIKQNEVKLVIIGANTDTFSKEKFIEPSSVEISSLLKRFKKEGIEIKNKSNLSRLA